MTNEQFEIIEDDAGFDRFEAYFKDHEFISFDTETTGLAKDATIIGYSMAAELHLGWYVVLYYWDKINKVIVKTPIFDRAVHYLQEVKKKNLVTHYGIVDVQWVKTNFQVNLLESVHTDTMVLVHTVDENKFSYQLKELGVQEFGEDAKKEQAEMKASVIEQGGIWEEKKGGSKEMYKADRYIMGRYAAKDAILTLKILYAYLPRLFEQKLEKFFYEEETMPLFKTCTYQLNTVGLKIDIDKLQQLESELRANCARLMEEINFEIKPYIQDKYPGTSAVKTFNINSGQQLAWLLFTKLGNDWKKVTKGGRVKAVELLGKPPYTPTMRKLFVNTLNELGIKPEKYIQCDKKALLNYSSKYKWVAKLLEYKKEEKLLNTYVEGIQRFMKYGVIHPGFLQHGTVSGRYSSRGPNFQNLPRDDKRIKKCIVARPGKTFVGADYSQLEPRTFTSQAQDPILLAGFKNNEDFYSVVGIPLFNKTECSANKKATNYFGDKFPIYRQISKTTALGIAYGETPYKLADELRDEEGKNLPIDFCTQLIEDYWQKYEGIRNFVNESHAQVVKTGVVYTQFGRPRHIPEAKKIALFGFPESCSTKDLKYNYRTLLNLAVSFRVQGTAASIINRAAIAFIRRTTELGIECNIVMQVHDEIIAECNTEHAETVAAILKDCMENTNSLNGVALIADPKIAQNIADLK